MPQLDKYILFSQILSFTIFFFLIYMYIRKKLIPIISTILKYRKKKLHLLSRKVNGYGRFLMNVKFRSSPGINESFILVYSQLFDIYTLFLKLSTEKLYKKISNFLYFGYFKFKLALR